MPATGYAVPRQKGFRLVSDKAHDRYHGLDMAKWRKKRSKVSLETQRRELYVVKGYGTNRAVF